MQQGSDNAKADLKKQSEQAEGEAKTLAETAQEYVEVAKTEIGKAAEYVSGVVTGATEGAKPALIVLKIDLHSVVYKVIPTGLI